MYTHKIKKQLMQATMFAMSGMMLVVLSFTVLEPTVSQAITSTPFTIRQQVTAEISFTLQPANVAMVGALGGVTGGNATGSVSVAVLTNSTTGYTMDISFQNSPAMKGEVTNSAAIGNYGTTSEPTFAYFASSSATFAYTVAASSSTDVDPSFMNNGSACNTGAVMTANTCWMTPSSTNFRIINRNTAAATTTATTTLAFKVLIPNNPTVPVTSDFYTATATLTAVTQ